MPILRSLEPFSNVVAGQRAVMQSQLVLGNTIHEIVLRLGGTFTKSDILKIRVLVNNKTIMEVSGTQLDTINKYLNLPDNATHLSIPFIEHSARSIVGQEFGALDTTAGVSQFTIEVDLDTAANGVANPTLEAYAWLGPPKAATDPAKLFFRALLTSTLTPNSAAEHTLSPNIGSQAGGLLKRLFHFDASSIIDSFEVKRNGIEIFEEVPNALNDYVQDVYGLADQANLHVFDAVVDGNQSNAVRTLNAGGKPAPFQFLYTTNAGGTINVLTDGYFMLPLI